MVGLHLLIEKYIAELEELESSMAEVKRRLQVVTEAFRLLEEEELSEDCPSEQPRADVEEEKIDQAEGTNILRGAAELLNELSAQ